jgi:membrane-anchored protein YejM (alkaline phosphatase superfamily)
MRHKAQIPRKVFIRKYLAELLGVSGKTIERRFWPVYNPLVVRKYLISRGFLLKERKKYKRSIRL